jgi:hypothetical protein
MVVLGGAVAAAAILAATLVVAPAVQRIRTNERSLSRVEEDVRSLQALRPRVASLQEKSAALSRRFPAGQGTTRQESPLAMLTVAVQAAGVPQSSFSLASGGARDGERFREESFDIKIENRSFLDMVKVVSALADGKYPLLVRSVNLKARYEGNGSLDGVIRVGYLTAR